MLVMKIDEMRKFVDKVSDHKVKVKHIPIKEISPFAGIAQVAEDGSMSISVTKGIYTSLAGKPVNKVFIRAFLLHELGHLHTEEDKAAYKNEYNAHIWAITKAQKLGYKKVVASLREEIVSWNHLENNRSFQKYRKASELYLEKQGFII